MATRRSTRARRRPVNGKPPWAQRVTFRSVFVTPGNIGGGHTAGTADRLTNITNVIEAQPAPDIELLRSKLTFVQGTCSYRPDLVEAYQYAYALFIGPDTLDINDIDPLAADGRVYWQHRYLTRQANRHDDGVGTQIDSATATIKTAGMRRLKNFGESLWFAESVSSASGILLAENQWNFRVGVELP